MRVLIVEDDPVLAANLRVGLAGRQILADLACDGVAGLDRASTQRYDVIVLDVMLPGGIDGFEVCSALRRRPLGTPILMLTGRDGVPDRVRGLEAGADDYLVKPFALEELTARLRALVRRQVAHRGAVLEVGGLRFDTRRGTADVDGRPLRLTAKEAALLALFLHAPGEVLRPEEIYEQVWPGLAAPASNLVDVYVGRLRRKLIEAAARVTLRSLKRQGYRLEGAEPRTGERAR